MTFAEILQTLMDDRKLSVAETARLTGVPDATIRSILRRNSQSVALDIAFKFASGFRVPIEYLNGELDNINETDTKKETLAAAKTEAKVSEEKMYEVLIQAFEKMGIVKPGEDLSDDDLTFFEGIIKMLRFYRSKK